MTAAPRRITVPRGGRFTAKTERKPRSISGGLSFSVEQPRGGLRGGDLSLEKNYRENSGAVSSSGAKK